MLLSDVALAERGIMLSSAGLSPIGGPQIGWIFSSCRHFKRRLIFKKRPGRSVKIVSFAKQQHISAMDDQEEYKPRLGFDIRVRTSKKAGGKKKSWQKVEETICEHPGCDKPATAQVAKSPREPNEKIWLCAAHAAQHNRNWNYFEGLSAKEAENARAQSYYGDRPTWSLGKNDRARAAAKGRKPSDFDDVHGLFDGKEGPAAPAPEARKLPRLQAKALETLDLEPGADATKIRRRYADLLRRYHPDSNGGDRSAEAQLQEVVKAHQILKKAGLC